MPLLVTKESSFVLKVDDVFSTNEVIFIYPVPGAISKATGMEFSET